MVEFAHSEATLSPHPKEHPEWTRYDQIDESGFHDGTTSPLRTLTTGPGLPLTRAGCAHGPHQPGAPAGTSHQSIRTEDRRESPCVSTNLPARPRVASTMRPRG